MEPKPTSPAPPEDLHGRRIHFCGIGGVGMSGLARLTRAQGAICTGSDQHGSETIDHLIAQGFPVSLEQSRTSLPSPCDLLVISAAVSETHPEVAAARERGVPTLKYAQMLGRVMAGRTGVAIAGTHGKSTTTSMLSHILIDNDADPSFIVGATCQQIGGGSRTGQGPLLIAEACEYDRSFHNLRPTHAAILNIEEDHMEIYHTLDAIVEAFHQFARLLPADGMLVINHDMAHRWKVTAGLACAVRTIGFAPQADYRVEMDPPREEDTEAGAETDPVSAPPPEASRSQTRLFEQGRLVATWSGAMPGEHMAYNAAVAATLAHHLGLPWDRIARSIAGFAGLDRRMQRLGQRALPTGGFATVIDDYGHHPTEVDTTLRALRQHYRPRRMICVFQPHQHSRTRFLLDQFAASFTHADLVIVPQIYFVRDSEAERQSIRATDLVDRLRDRGRRATHVYPADGIVEQLHAIARDGDLIVTMGAGDVWQVAQQYLGS